MRRWRGLNVSIAYPGRLGGQIPDPPPGYEWVVDENGEILTDDQGVKIATPHGPILYEARQTFPEPPDGFAYLTNDVGNVLTDDDGNWLTVPVE